MAAPSIAIDLQGSTPGETPALEPPHWLHAIVLGITMLGLSIVSIAGTIELARAVIPTVLGPALAAMAHPALFVAW